MSDKQIPHQRRSAEGGEASKDGARRGTVRRRRRPTPPPAPLGSITTTFHETDGPQVCPDCGGTELTRVELVLTDATVVIFISCHDCERRAWFAGLEELPIEAVLERSAKR